MIFRRYDLIVIHDFDGRPYYKALEESKKVLFVNSRPFRFFIRDLIKKKTVTKDVLNSLLVFFLIPFFRKRNILLAMAPLNWRVLLYGTLHYKNQVIYHSSWPFWSMGSTPFSYGFFDPLLALIWKKYLNNFRFIVAVTKSSKKSLSVFSDRQDVVQIYHSVDCNEIDSVDFSKKWLNVETFTVGFLGRLEYSKGVDDVIEIAKQCRCNMVVAGFGSLENKIVRAEASNFLTYNGHLKDRELVRKFLSGLHILLLPSKKTEGWEELFGLVIVEAMSQGVVVITTSHVGPIEIIENSVDGYVFSEKEYVASTGRLLNSNCFVDFENVAANAISSSRKFKLSAIKKEWESLIG